MSEVDTPEAPNAAPDAAEPETPRAPQAAAEGHAPGVEASTDVPLPAAAGAPPADPTGERKLGYHVQLPSFEGPLDLLLHLIEEHELNVMDIPIAFVAAKYVEYITLMDELNIDVASEYLVMAATLTHIKSKMLLPVVPSDQEDEQEAELDPRAELVRRLLEYQKYKHAAAEMSDGSVLGRDVFLRGLPAPDVEGPAPLAGLSLFKLLDAFQAVLSRAKTTLDHQIDFERFSITDRINELSDLLRARGRLLFEDLFEGSRNRGELIVTFLALLEMTRLRLTRLDQDGPLAPIFVELAVSEDAESSDGLPASDESEPSDELDFAREAARSADREREPSGQFAGEPDEDEEPVESDSGDDDTELSEDWRDKPDMEPE